MSLASKRGAEIADFFAPSLKIQEVSGKAFLAHSLFLDPTERISIILRNGNYHALTIIINFEPLKTLITTLSGKVKVITVGIDELALARLGNQK